MRSQSIGLLHTSLKCTKQWQTSQSSTRLYPCLFSTSSVSQSGHNRWSKIRHDKGANDAKRGSAFSKISQEISYASKSGGLDGNLRLTAAVAAAKKAGMPKERIQGAINRGQGISASGVALETLIMEAMGPGSVALVLECVTDNKLRALQETKSLLTKCNATTTPTSYLFTKRGIIHVLPGKVDFDTILEATLEIDGTEDVEECEDENGKGVEITTEPSRTSAVAEEIKTRLPEVQVTSSVIAWVPNEDTMVELQEGSKAEEQLTKLLNLLEESDHVSEIYTNLRS
ncbi:DUF28-domain-containing protein [Morchella conica CCBAS932]|uniref:DUF28-domain-containing protein n=1 Tax=Morchella conica CCBAS932 TaxID=1392247 RepID=A0A3N4L3M9_9PEZI|nr:DUF28-domain-containing protein [Morchella conica CCBAS932]